MKGTNYPLMIPGELYQKLRNASEVTGLKLAETMRQSMNMGLPSLVEALAKRRGRATLVDPLPAADLAAFYRQKETDQDGIDRFTAAQSFGGDE